jgi:hypothetical protein
MTPEALQAQAERTALRIILSNVVAQLLVAHSSDPLERRARLSQLHDECKRAAEQSTSTLAGDERRDLTNLMLSVLDEFYKGITIT